MGKLNSIAVNPACYSWGTDFEQFARVSTSAGFTALEFSIQQAQAFATARQMTPQQVGIWLDDIGATVVQFSGIIPDGDVLPAPLLVEAQFYEATVNSVNERLEFASAIGCSNAAIVVNPRISMSRDEAWSLAVSRLVDLADRASQFGIGLNVEFVAVGKLPKNLDGPTPFIRTAADIARLLDEVGRPNCRSLLDVCHLAASGELLADLGVLNGRVGFIQVSDLKSGDTQVEDSERVIPGEGQLDFARIANWVHDMSYAGPWSIELFSEEIWELPIKTAAQRLHLGATRLSSIIGGKS